MVFLWNYAKVLKIKLRFAVNSRIFGNSFSERNLVFENAYWNSIGTWSYVVIAS